MSDEDVSKIEAEYIASMKETIEKNKAAKAAEEKQKYESELREKIEKEIKDKYTTAGINLTVPAKKDKSPKNDLKGFMDAFNKRHGYTPVEYGSGKWLSGYEFTDSDAGCENDVSAWTPSEVFANMIWSAFYCKGYLAGKVTVRGVDFTRGKGDTVSIRIRGKRTAQGPLDPCECLSCVSQTFSVESLSLDSYGDMAEICELDLQFAGDEVKAGIIEDMADGLAEAVDEEIYNQLITSGTGSTGSIEACCEASDDDCCMDKFGRQLVNEIINQEASKREQGYKLDYCILSPSVAAHFKFKEASSMIGLPLSYSGNELAKIGNLNVIEYPCASSCSDEKFIAAVLIDSRRAVGEGWGKRPELEQDRNIDCDSTTVAIHMYVGIDDLDTEAIVLIYAPPCA